MTSKANKELGLKSAAVLTIKDADKMTPEGRHEVAMWLRDQARSLKKYGDQYASTYRGRYLYRDE